LTCTGVAFPEMVTYAGTGSSAGACGGAAGSWNPSSPATGVVEVSFPWALGALAGSLGASAGFARPFAFPDAFGAGAAFGALVAFGLPSTTFGLPSTTGLPVSADSALSSAFSSSAYLERRQRLDDGLDHRGGRGRLGGGGSSGLSRRLPSGLRCRGLRRPAATGGLAAAHPAELLVDGVGADAQRLADLVGRLALLDERLDLLLTLGQLLGHAGTPPRGVAPHLMIAVRAG
jgi:hypothetical protein